MEAADPAVGSFLVGSLASLFWLLVMVYFLNRPEEP